MKKLRRSTEPEVIAEFLKNEFYHNVFHQDRESFERLVLEADVENPQENALRRALLFRRRGHMWRELPEQTQWWEIRLELDDLRCVRVFPRPPWRRAAGPGLWLRDAAERLRHMTPAQPLAARVQSLSRRLAAASDDSAVLLIGIDEQQPLTILEGNHRLTAALLAGPQTFQQQFRVFVGFSAEMAHCCWYETNPASLWRYARNRLRNLFYDRDADIELAQRVVTQPRAAEIIARPLQPVRASKTVIAPK